MNNSQKQLQVKRFKHQNGKNVIAVILTTCCNVGCDTGVVPRMEKECYEPEGPERRGTKMQEQME